MKQLGLFTDAAPRPLPHLEADQRLAARVPPNVLLGPSTWTFPGWEGIVYPSGVTREELLDRGLGWAARYPLFRTVGIDRSHYAPLTDADLARYRDELPPGFLCVMKVWNAITTFADPRSGARTPRFLDADALEEHVLLPIGRSFQGHAGPLVLQLAPIHPKELPDPGAFAEELDRFFSVLPTAFSYAVELRNRELLTPAYLAVLARHRVAHVLNLWERMPGVGRQLAVPGVLTAPFVVCRLSIPPGQHYEDRKRDFAPFNRLMEVCEAARDDVALLAQACAEPRRTLYLTVNNKVEGSSPLTIRALAERLGCSPGIR
jgi:uncharacterized protein YecE (DUF72 family)